MSTVDGAPAPLPREPNRPDAPNPDLYNPRRWLRLHNTADLGWLAGGEQRKFNNPPNYESTGWMTFKDTDKMYPTLDSVLKFKEKPLNRLWDPDQRNMQELKMPRSKRPALEADIVTMLALERRRGSERREMNPMYEDYQRTPLTLPPKLSDEEMSLGPLKAPPQLPLMAPSGEVVSLAPPPAQEIPMAEFGPRKRNLEDYLDEAPILPMAKYHYPIDSPAASTFKFTDGRAVSDIIKPGPLDGNILRGSAEAVEYGKSVEKQEAPFKRPYTWEGMPVPLPPDFKVPKYEPELDEAQQQEYEEWLKTQRRQISRKVRRVLERGQQELKEQKAAKKRGEKIKTREEKMRERFVKNYMKAQLKLPETHPHRIFLHYEDVSDRDSHLHVNKTKKILSSRNGEGEPEKAPPTDGADVAEGQDGPEQDNTNQDDPDQDDTNQGAPNRDDSGDELQKDLPEDENPEGRETEEGKPGKNSEADRTDENADRDVSNMNPTCPPNIHSPRN
ncbi:hypothetical protein F4776DRAFT_253792 [Hypoxylon sp. NC0597]|nr:hypothetical protein F4776DRAFT_253792 [Hypoxylon sp. NC0597]